MKKKDPPESITGVWVLKERKASLSIWSKVLLEKLVVP